MFAEHPELAVVSVGMYFYDEKGIFGSLLYPEWPQKEDLLYGSPFCHAGCMVRRKVYEELGGYRTEKEISRIEDYDLWFRLYQAGYIGYNIQEYLLSLIHICAESFIAIGMKVPRSYPPMNALLLMSVLVVSRLFYRSIAKKENRKGSTNKKRTMIIGAGQAGAMAVRDLNSSEHSRNKVVCFIDDDNSKKGKYLQGVKIAGDRSKICDAVKKYNVEEILLAIPTAPLSIKNEILDVCKKTKCQLKIIPGIYQLANGDVNIEKIRNVQIEDLLGRE